MYLVIAYHGKGKKDVEKDLERLQANFDNFTKLVKVKHVYFFRAEKDDSGANLVLIIEYSCARSCSATSHKCGIAEQTLASKSRNVNYWFYVRDKGQESRGKGKTR
jgi:hypothetical protein